MKIGKKGVAGKGIDSETTLKNNKYWESEGRRQTYGREDAICQWEWE